MLQESFRKLHLHDRGILYALASSLTLCTCSHSWKIKVRFVVEEGRLDLRDAMRSSSLDVTPWKWKRNEEKKKHEHRKTCFQQTFMFHSQLLAELVFLNTTILLCKAQQAQAQINSVGGADWASSRKADWEYVQRICHGHLKSRNLAVLATLG